ncbi:MAG: SLBB domain-containing protein [Holophaga sp.]|nr:SLBB domain-containing protein [Holophaga sp.]
MACPHGFAGTGPGRGWGGFSGGFLGFLLGLAGVGSAGAVPQVPAAVEQAQARPPKVPEAAPKAGAKSVPAAADPAPAAPVHPAPAAPSKPFVLASDLFATTLASPRPPEVRMGSDYVIGSGDQLALTTFGSVALARVLKVDRGGKVSIPDVGLLEVSGLTLDAARAMVRAALRRKYSGLEQFNLEVVGLHDVEVMVIGEVGHAGSYLVPSASSPMALLGLAGGPSDHGSYRSIRHLRAGKVIQTLDLYRLRFEGTGLESRGFLDGDTLFVPLAGTRITAMGAFRRTAAAPGGVLMELAPGESAQEAVHFAGGLIPAASQVLVTVQRVSADGISTVRDIPNLPADLRAARFCEGDVLRALAREERLEEYVEAAGRVAVPGRFSYREGMRVRDLLALGGAGGQLLPDSYRLRGEILRTLADGRTRLLSFDVDRAQKGDEAHNLPLQPRDRVELGDVADLRLAKRVTILGPFTRPGVFDWHEGMRAADLIYRAGVPKLSAARHYAELARMGDGKTNQVIRLDLARLLSTEEQAPVALEDEQVNPTLQPYDQITIYENPDFRMHRTVTVLGQVQRPGPYVIQEERFTLRELVARAGGLTADAMPAGAIFLRSSLEPRDLSAREPGPGPEPGPGSFKTVNEILQRLNETRRARDTGALESSPLLHGLLQGELNRMVVDLPAVLEGDPRQDVVLLDGDQVFIPRRTDSVCVVGEVASSFSTFHVRPGDRVRDLLKLAGGYTRNADRAQVRLLKADGRVLDSRVERAAIDPGDALLVPQRIRKDVPWQDTLLAMTPIAILYNAIRR